MNIKRHHRLTPFLYKGIVVTGLSMILLAGLSYFFGSQGIIEPRNVWANDHYGILGRQAPELELNTWIDGEGDKVDPILLSDYRGKVVYLYFFQDW